MAKSAVNKSSFSHFCKQFLYNYNDVNLLCIVSRLNRFMACLCRHLPDVEVTLESMLKPRVAMLPGHIQSVYVQNICKLYGRVLAKAEASDDGELVQRASRLVSDHLALFVHSADLEVQERVCS